MIFNHELLFIHNGKTGGLSCARYLLDNLDGMIFNCGPGENKKDSHNITNINSINLHCTLRSAKQHLARDYQKNIADFKKILACIRHPYTLEISFYLHLKKPRVRERRKNDQWLLDLSDGCFEEFVRHAGFHRSGIAQQDYFIVDGVIPDNVHLIRYENLVEEFTQACSPFMKPGPCGIFPHINKSTQATDKLVLLTERAKSLIQQKHAFMFESGYYSP